jgi:putative FmdB family regulatory protein
LPVYEYVCQECSVKFDLKRPMNQSENPATCLECAGVGIRVYSVFTALTKGIGTISTRHSSATGKGTAVVASSNARSQKKTAETADIGKELYAVLESIPVEADGVLEASIDGLAKAIGSFYASDQAITIERGGKPNSSTAGLSLQVDLTVWRSRDVDTSSIPQKQRYISEVLWQVVTANGGGALAALNRLILGAAQRKMIVCDNVEDTTTLLNLLRRGAEACSGQVYLCVFPSQKEKHVRGLRMWLLKSGRWNAYPD